MQLLVCLSGCGGTDSGSGSDGGGALGEVGDPCHEGLETIPPDGFRRNEIYLQNAPDAGAGWPSADCLSGICIVNHYEGDLVDECVEPCGAACGWECIEDRVYCTCKCGGPVDVTCPECPAEFECCEIFAVGLDWFVGSYCVREGTCAEQ